MATKNVSDIIELMVLVTQDEKSRRTFEVVSRIFIDAVGQLIGSGHDVKLRGLGTFKIVPRVGNFAINATNLLNQENINPFNGIIYKDDLKIKFVPSKMIGVNSV